MSLPGSVGTWPTGSATDVALATRVAFLSAVSESIPLHHQTKQQNQLVQSIIWSTDPRENGDIDLAKCMDRTRTLVADRIGALAPNHNLHYILDKLDFVEPTDAVSVLFEAIRGRVQLAYDKDLDVPLRPRVVRANDRTFAIRGAVPGSRECVDLIIYEHFDMRALALLPYILTHELVCHVAAQHSGSWPEAPDPDIRDFFCEGFMDRAAWTLIFDWLEDGDLPSLSPAGHLAEAETPHAIERPMAFSAGKAAWWNCISCTGAHRSSVAARYSAQQLVLSAALALNSSNHAVTVKDTLISNMLGRDNGVASAFAAMAVGEQLPDEFLSVQPLHGTG